MTYHKLDSELGALQTLETYVPFFRFNTPGLVLIVITTLGPFANKEPPSDPDSDTSSETPPSERNKAEMVSNHHGKYRHCMRL